MAEGLLKEQMAHAHITPAARDPERFVALTEGSIDTAPVAAGFRQVVRVPVTTCVRTLPACAKCGAETQIEDAFCVQCGTSTCDRFGVETDDGLLVPPGCAMTEADATDTVRRMLGRNDARVHLADVHGGTAVAVIDPYGRAWRMHDPLSKVVLLGHDGNRVPPPALSAPRHVRLAYCHLAPGTTEDAVRDAATKLAVWAQAVGKVVVEGASRA